MKKNGFCKESRRKEKGKKDTYDENMAQTWSNESFLNDKAIVEVAHIKNGLITVDSLIIYSIFTSSITRIAIFATNQKLEDIDALI